VPLAHDLPDTLGVNMTRLTLREASRLMIDAAELQGIFRSSPRGTGETVTLVPKDLTPVLEAQIAALSAVSELLRAQLTDTRKECDRWRQKAERLALPPPAQVPEPLRRRQRRWWQ
jgi:hypothetical protein